MCQSTSSGTLKTKSQYLGEILIQGKAVLKSTEIFTGKPASDLQTSLTCRYLSRMKCTGVTGERKQGWGGGWEGASEKQL